MSLSPLLKDLKKTYKEDGRACYLEPNHLSGVIEALLFAGYCMSVVLNDDSFKASLGPVSLCVLDQLSEVSDFPCDFASASRSLSLFNLKRKDIK